MNVFVDRKKTKKLNSSFNKIRSKILYSSKSWMKMLTFHTKLCVIFTEIGRMCIKIFLTEKQVIYY